MLGFESYHIILITMAALAGVAAWEVPRAVLWICLGALSYASSAWWHNMGFPYATLFGASTNFAICLLIAWLANRRYEMWIFNCLILMLLIDALYVSGFIQSRFAFAVSLEIVNAAAMILVIATGIMDRVARHGDTFDSRDFPFARHRNSYLLAKRPEYPQWWKHK